MEYYQAYQNRAAQTAAVINKYIPALKIGGVDAAGLLAQSEALDGLAQLRDDAKRVLESSYPQSEFLTKGAKTQQDPWWKVW